MMLPGDGNCFFNALTISKHMRISCPSTLRTSLCDALEDEDIEGEVKRLYYDVAKEKQYPLDIWVHNMRQNGSWGGATTAMFVCYVFRINICIVTNGARGFIINDIRSCQGCEFIDPDVPTIFLYHHSYKTPFKPSHVSNHFAFMYRYEGSDFDDFEIYCNARVPEERKDTENVDLTQTYDGSLPEERPLKRHRSTFSEEQQRCKDAEKCCVPLMGRKDKTQKRVKLAGMKDKKQSVLTQFLTRMKIDNEVVQNLETRKRSESEYAQLEIFRQVQCVVLRLVEHIHNAGTQGFEKPRLIRAPRLVHSTWQFRSLVIAFWVHPYFGGKNYELSARVFGVNENTLKTWVSQKQFFHKWIPIAATYTYKDVFHSIPKPYNETYLRAPLEKQSYEGLYAPFRSKASQKYLILCNNPREVGITRQKKHADAQRCTKTTYVSAKTKHITCGFQKGPKLKYGEVRKYISDVVLERWTRGNPISKLQLKDIVRTKFATHDAFKNVVLTKPNYFNKWVIRVLSDINFTDRKTSIAQKIPDDWRNIACKGTDRVRKLFKSLGIKRIFSADETNVKFHEVSDTVLAPRGIKSVGTACSIPSSDGCTVMVTMDMRTSQLTPPFIIYKGTFGGTLMKQWERFARGKVVFTKKHWMTSESYILYLQYLRLLCPGYHRIGLVVDKASMHMSEEVLDWIKSSNVTEKPEIICDFIEAGMTSIYQPPDVVINKPLKDALKKAYGNFRNEIAKDFVPGEHIGISREKLTDFILESYDKINDKNLSNPYIRRAFDLCGLNPYADDSTIEKTFIQHLDQLSMTSAYKALIDHHTALDLTH